MARRASGAVRLKVYVNEENDGTNLGAVASLLHALELGGVLETGTDDGKIDRVWSSSGTATTTPTERNLSSGSLNSPLLAASTAFEDLAAFIVVNTGLVDLLVGSSDGVSGSTDAVVVPAGGWLAWSAGSAGVAADGDDIITFSTATGTTTYKITVIGRSA